MFRFMIERRNTIMAMTKKAVALPKTETAAKTEAAAPAKAEEAKKETAVKAEAPAKKEAVKKETVKKETVKKEAAKKETVKKDAAKKAPAKKEAAPKKAAEKPAAAKKSAAKTEIHIQFSGKSYSNEDLIKIAKDVWKYDLQQKESDLTDIELYVKPEENLVYYVINGNYSGSFGI